MIGVESRNENRAEASRPTPLKRPVEMVIPDRDTPGIMASDCAIPIASASVESYAIQILAGLCFFSHEHDNTDHYQHQADE